MEEYEISLVFILYAALQLRKQYKTDLVKLTKEVTGIYFLSLFIITIILIFIKRSLTVAVVRKTPITICFPKCIVIDINKSATWSRLIGMFLIVSELSC